MNTIKTISQTKCFDGTQVVYSHPSTITQCEMRFGVYLPPTTAPAKKLPCLFWLSGLTCTEQNFLTKAGAQRIAAELGVILIAPDTSPRGVSLPGDQLSYDFGIGAGFYVDATESPWSTHYRMYSYITSELYDLVLKQFPVDPARIAIAGHSMGGLGALVAALRNPDRYQSVSAFAPIAAPQQSPWGQKAFAGYLGADKSTWQAYDPAALIKAQGWAGTILIDQGTQDEFLKNELHPELFAAACKEAGVTLHLRMQAGYDHSYYFISTFIEDHLRFHFGESQSSTVFVCQNKPEK
jgi:S-formylglutathione hydrolase